ncbi:MAG: tRNA preQ1(34) S-adenosylmethionine ribosyltransferase-isomerase QueA [Methylococcaceae bacterium]|nr:tRNA preQ1(34) S-adenosylmethionine ribosyltransferase-isomerase QueA [Methylococcaceae bacterium]
MSRSDLHYDLPERLIAQRPLAQRGASRLLVVDGATNAWSDRHFGDLPDLLKPGDLLVFNATRVIPARLHGHKASGGRIEILVERLVGAFRAWAHVKASKSPKPGAELILQGSHRCRVIERDTDLFLLEFDTQGPELPVLLEQIGHMPLPPYIQRNDEPFDRERYQTVFGSNPGAVAAPTAGLHFDQAMLERLAALGIEATRVTLHVGSGTFQPLRTESLDEHRMHAEFCEVGADTVAAVERAHRRGNRVVAVGTTAIRSLETAALGGQLAPYRGETRLFIRPGFPFRCVDALLTNFHLPESTLLALVCAFAGYDTVMAAYHHAISQEYRFFSYGDAMFLTRPAPVPNP